LLSFISGRNDIERSGCFLWGGRRRRRCWCWWESIVADCRCELLRGFHREFIAFVRCENFVSHRHNHTTDGIVVGVCNIKHVIVAFTQSGHTTSRVLIAH
jgi:hypothetical protein